MSSTPHPNKKLDRVQICALDDHRTARQDAWRKLQANYKNKDLKPGKAWQIYLEDLYQARISMIRARDEAERVYRDEIASWNWNYGEWPE